MTDTDRHPDVTVDALLAMGREMYPAASAARIRMMLDAAYREGWQLVPRDADDDPWVEIDHIRDVPRCARIRQEWKWFGGEGARYWVHRDDLPDPDADLIEKMAQSLSGASTWDVISDVARENWRKKARAALAAYREATQ